jgi:hypothetical protein
MLRIRDIFTVVALASVTCVAVAACNHEEAVDSARQAITVDDGTIFGNTFSPGPPTACAGDATWLPPGTKTSFGKKGTLDVVLPPDWHAVDVASMVASGGGKVTCTCNKESGGCSPDESGNCYMTTCSNCSKSTSLAVILNDAGVRLATTEELGTLPNVTSDMFKVPEVVQAIQAFNLQFYPEGQLPQFDAIDGSNASAPDGYTFVAVYVFGHLSAFPIPTEMAKMVGGASSGGLSCACNVGSGCPMDSTWGHKYCDASSCKSCTMSGTSAFAPAELLGVY